MVVIPAELLSPSGQTPRTLAAVNQRLLNALDSAGYVSYSYFLIPDGFALVTQLEQIHEDGTPFSGDARFSEEKPLESWTLVAFGRALFIPRQGYFRIIVFMVSSIPFAPSEKVPSGREAEGWIGKGMNALPNEIGELPYSDNVKVTALVYELLQPPEVAAVIRVPGLLPARIHLERGHLWAGLQK